MCARYTLTQKDPNSIKKRFKVDAVQGNVKFERYNIAPSQEVPVLFNNSGKRVLAAFRWGLIPSWAKEASIGTKMINARIETLSEKVSFKRLLKTNRCLVISDGFYEWVTDSSGKYPMRFIEKYSSLFAFAGLWDQWRDPKGNTVLSFTIITTGSAPSELIRKYHDRMPLILTEDLEDEWIESKEEPAKLIQRALTQTTKLPMTSHRVSTLVNSPRNDSEEILEEV